MELLLLSFFGAVELNDSSGLGLTVFSGLATEEDDDEEDSFFLIAPTSPVFFFTLSLFAFTPSVLTLAFTFGALSFLVLSD